MNQVEAYLRLGLQPDCSLEDVKQAFSDKISKCHPEEHPREYLELQQAYQLLKKLKKSQKHLSDVWDTDPSHSTNGNDHAENQPGEETWDHEQPEDLADDMTPEDSAEKELKDEFSKLDEELSQEEKERLEEEEKEKKKKLEEAAKWAVLSQIPGWSALSPGQRSAVFLCFGLIPIGIKQGETAGLFTRGLPQEFIPAVLNLFAKEALETLKQMEPCPKRICRKVRKEFLKACFWNCKGVTIRPLRFEKENGECLALMDFLNQNLGIHPPGDGVMKPIHEGTAFLIFFYVMFVPVCIGMSCPNAALRIILFFPVVGGPIAALFWRMKWNNDRWRMLAVLGFVAIILTAYYFMDADMGSLPRLLWEILSIVEFAAMMVGVGAFFLQRVQELRNNKNPNEKKSGSRSWAFCKKGG